MNVCFIYFKYPLYPEGSYFQEFLNRVACNVDNVHLVAGHYPKGLFLKESNLRIFWVPLLKIKYLDELFFMFQCLLKVVFTQELKNSSLVNSIGPRGLLAGLYLKWRFKVPLVCTIEILNERGGFLNNIYYRLVKFLLTKIPIDKFICWANYYSAYLKKWGISESKIEIIPCGIDTERYNPNIDGSEIKNKYAPDCPLIVFAKPLYAYNSESAKILVQIVAKLRAKRKIKLLIGGGERRAEIEKLTKELGVEDLIDFMPPTLFTDIPKYIAASDLIVLPFVYAPTTSRSLIEAMAMGKPIITVPVGEIKEVLVNNESAIIVQRDPSEIAKAVNNVLSNKDLMQRLGSRALDLALNTFSLNIIVERELSLFREMLDKKILL